MKSLLVAITVFFYANVAAQKKSPNLIYVDNEGVLRYTKDKKEATFFGVNYTVPFAYGYRSHKALGIHPEKAIDADVYHMSRLGLNAFRVHVWDVEISDSLGNLLENEHLRLFDYLIKKLKEQHIKILITPIAFWGNGYPEPDVKTTGFASVYGKRLSVVKEEALKAQEAYLKQFFQHVNSYTGLTYRDDPDVIAMEINNEPQHSGPKERTTEYVQRMKAAVLSTGWTKPIFYNISESPTYADAIVKANVDGHSFQWYPTGLVANREIKGNFLPNVDQYAIPFGDTIAAFRKKARMVYEFDAGDVAQPVMYAAMARSYRTAGFGWATQFAYDPLYTAYANTEYQTHYLNLVYTPAKAISLLIAGKAFHRLPRGKSWGAYPEDTLFDAFRVSYKAGLSEMNSGEEFYYTGSTNTQPRSISKLAHIAGVGSSAVVEYGGTGAYFLDKVSDGVWMLEVMPDVINISDPFQKASPKKEVARIESRRQPIKLNLPGFEQDFSVLAEKGRVSQKARSNFFVQPGRYFISRIDNSKDYKELRFPPVTYSLPSPLSTEPFVSHIPLKEVSAGKSFFIKAEIAGADSSDKILIEVHNSWGKWNTIQMQHMAGYSFGASVPVDMVTPGLINYRIFINKANGNAYTFPGALKGNPYAWDEYRNETWQTFVAARESPLEVFDAARDRKELMIFNPNWRDNQVSFSAGNAPGSLALKMVMQKPEPAQVMGAQFFFGEKIKGRVEEVPSFTKLIVRVRSEHANNASISLITKNGDAYGTTVSLAKEWKDIEVPLATLNKVPYLLLPRPYPGFLPLWFTSSGNRTFNISDAEKLEIYFKPKNSSEASIEVQWVWLAK